MSSYATAVPVPGGLGPRGRRPMPAPPFDPTGYWATRKWVSVGLGSVSSDVTALSGRVDAIERRDPPLAGRSFSLARNEDLYRALSEIIPRLGGTVTGA